MTIASPAAQPLYTISGVGPYTVTNPYRDASDLRITAIADGARTVLDPADYTISPQRGLTTGSVTLSSGAATTHAGAQLEILRQTPTRQDWAGVASSREKGIEAALDFAIMAQQDFERDTQRALLLPSESGIEVEIPQLAAGRANKFLGFDADGNPTASLSGPTGTPVSSFMEAWLALTTQLAALNALGGTDVGRALFQAANQGAGRTALGLGGAATMGAATEADLSDEAFVDHLARRGLVVDWVAAQLTSYLPIAAGYDSGNLSWTAGAAISPLTHGLGGIPSRWEAYLICKSANNGWAVGDRVKVGDYFSNGGSIYGMTIAASSTQIKGVVGASGLIIHHATSAGAVTALATEWDLRIFAWA